MVSERMFDCSRTVYCCVDACGALVDFEHADLITQLLLSPVSDISTRTTAQGLERLCG